MNNENETVRYCKKCGCELMSTNTHKLCDHCRRERARKRREGFLKLGAIAGGVFLTVVTKNNHGGGNRT